jgi:predicted enzyme related to lactoylglutathione lyase
MVWEIKQTKEQIMQTLQDNYLTAYRKLKLTRDVEGVHLGTNKAMASEPIRDPVKDQLLPRLLAAMLLIASATTNHSAFAQTGPSGQTADGAPHPTATNEPALTGVAAYFRSGPYVRVILPRSEARAFVEQYVDKLGGHLAWDFEFPAAHIRVIGFESKLGNFSVEFTDVYDSLPEYRKNTRIMYVCDDVQATLEAARDAGLKVVQPKAVTPVGINGRFELVPGYVIEVVWMPPKP